MKLAMIAMIASLVLPAAVAQAEPPVIIKLGPGPRPDPRFFPRPAASPTGSVTKISASADFRKRCVYGAATTDNGCTSESR